MQGLLLMIKTNNYYLMICACHSRLVEYYHRSSSFLVLFIHSCSGLHYVSRVISASTVCTAYSTVSFLQSILLRRSTRAAKCGPPLLAL